MIAAITQDDSLELSLDLLYNAVIVNSRSNEYRRKAMRAPLNSHNTKPIVRRASGRQSARLERTLPLERI